MDLPDGDFLGADTSSSERLGHGKRGRDPHECGVESVSGRGNQPGQRFQAQLLGSCPTGEDDGTGTVAQRRRVAGGHLSRVRLRWERGQLFRRGVAPDALVVFEEAAWLLATGR
jgi:hypothetical protein